MNLVIGNTSQQSYYYPEDYIKISSRNIDFNYLSSNNFESVYITFAEQRIYEKNIDYISTNYIKTLDLIKSVIDKSDKVVIFGSCEIWSNKTGIIKETTTPDFDISNEYTLSKFLLINEIKRLRNIDDIYNKVVIINPFYFNSVYRNKYFLFGKIFDSIINKKRIEVGNLNFYRDMVHTNFLVKKVIESKNDMLVGSGKLFNVRDFIIDLYHNFEMDYFYYVKEDRSQIVSNEKLIRANVDWKYTYDNLMIETVNDINNFIKRHEIK